METMRERRFDYSGTYWKALESQDPIKFIDDKWGSPFPYYNEFILPLIKNKTRLNIVEIGSGFGRYSGLVIPYCSTFYAIDSSDICCAFLGTHFDTNIVKCLSMNELDTIPNNIDLIFSFSTMLHFNLYEIWWYINKLANKIKDDEHFVIHYSSFESSDGVDFFINGCCKNCDNFGDTGLYRFHHSSQIKLIAEKYKLYIIDDKEPDNVIVPGHRVITLRKE